MDRWDLSYKKSFDFQLKFLWGIDLKMEYKKNISERDRMDDNMNPFSLLKRNFRCFFPEIKLRKELKKEYILDKFMHNIPSVFSSGYEDL